MWLCSDGVWYTGGETQPVAISLIKSDIYQVFGVENPGRKDKEYIMINHDKSPDMIK